MLSRKEMRNIKNVDTLVETAFNYNDAYVDFNVIPDGATSTLVIDRSVFAEHMVKPAFTIYGLLKDCAF